MHLRARAGLIVALAAAVLVATTVSASADPTIIRYLGNDRYESAAALSRNTFGGGAPVAYVASGADFPDALAGAPAAFKDNGPLLLTQSDAIPGPTSTELARLQPHDIYVLGGTSSVSPTVLSQLGQYAIGGGVHRLAGPDRYGTAAAVAADRFPSTNPTVYVASGEGFPDALSGGAAAGAAGSPLLLVSHGAVPPATATQLTRLDPTSIVLLGGTGTIDAGMEASLVAAAPHATVTRIGGTDRYDTAVLVAQHAFSSSTRVYVVTGLSFPDALAAAAVAPRAPGPVLLVPGTCMPAEVDAEISALAPPTVVVLGGQSSVSDDAANGIVCEDADS